MVESELSCTRTVLPDQFERGEATTVYYPAVAIAFPSVQNSG